MSSPWSLSSPQTWRIVLPWVLAGLLTLLAASFVQARRRIRALRDAGLHMPPHHPVFGHLLVVNDVMSRLPANAHPQYMPGIIQRLYPDVGPLFYLDMWPFGQPMLVISSPSAAYQVTQKHSLPKSEGLRFYMRPLTGNMDLFSMNGREWKYWRKIFNPGFSIGHVANFVPEITKEVSIFCDLLEECSKADRLFLLEDAAINMTIDTIGVVALGVKLGAQRTRNEFVNALRSQIRWLTFGSEPNLFKRWNPVRPLINWYFRKRMDDYLGSEIDQRFSLYGQSEKAKTDTPKSVVDLAFSKYLEENPSSHSNGKIDAVFRHFAINQVKTFILAGHDTTSLTLCYMYHLLYKHPSALKRVRQEHDAVFGSDLDQIPTAIETQLPKLNQLPFTLAIIKETLRLFPPGSSVRDGEPGFLVEEDGKGYPTDGFIVWSVHQAMHRDPSLWYSPNEFLPERWLLPDDDPRQPVKGAWRPFEFGPRHCIGQEIAILEVKIVMLMTLRRFDFRTAFDEWDASNKKAGPRTVDGERAYQVLDGTNRGPDGFPCRVSLASTR